MSLTTQIEKIKKDFSDQIKVNENLSKYSWFNLGGPASLVFKPKDQNQLSNFLKNIKNLTNIKVIGAGSNILIRDGGFDGVIIKLGKSFTNLSLLDENTISAGSGTLDRTLSNFAHEKSLSGFEFLSCIPGTIGGGIRMNSGCYEKDISQILVSIEVMNILGEIKLIKAKDINFSYRGCDISSDLIFINATFQGKKENKLKIKEKMENLIERKKKDQPSQIKTCGSTFKNPNKNKAWKLIKDSGCVGMNVGDAWISEKHCNFFVNKGKATSKDLENLINQVKEKVLKITGVSLELELQIIGNDK